MGIYFHDHCRVSCHSCQFKILKDNYFFYNYLCRQKLWIRNDGLFLMDCSLTQLVDKSIMGQSFMIEKQFGTFIVFRNHKETHIHDYIFFFVQAYSTKVPSYLNIICHRTHGFS